MDFTLNQYQRLLEALKASGMPYRLRHDVDLRPANSLRVAKIEAAMGVTATYYYRTVKESYDEEVIRAIAAMGHETGYHYECLTTTHGDMEEAYADFCRNLERLRRLAPVHSICMHGSPRSPWDSRDLWKHYDYRLLGIDYEPYLDTDFSRTLYMTDTGRRWDGYRVSVRDKIPEYQDLWERQGLVFHTTADVVAQLEDAASPLRTSGLELLITTHPQRWNPWGMAYLAEWATQNAKNIVKRKLVEKKKKKSLKTQ